MKRYKILVELKNGDRVEAYSLGKSEEEALAILLVDERFTSFVGVGEAERTKEMIRSVHITCEGEDKPVEDNGRFMLQPCKKKGWWIVTDLETLVCIRFKEGDFQHTQKVTSIEEPTCGPLQTATSLRMIVEYLFKFHAELL